MIITYKLSNYVLTMTSINFDKTKFTIDCIAEFRNNDVYDITMAFDEYFNKIFTPEFESQFTADQLLNLYDELYLMFEKELIDDYESDAGTDDERN